VDGLEEGRLVPSLQRIDATELARATLAESEVASDQKEVRLVLDGGAPVIVDADPVLLRRVVDNLLSNAVTHSPRSGEVRIGVCLREEGVELWVTDQGPGVPAEHRERVFEKYAQVQMRREGVSANRGLGLTFCRLAIEAHGGTIWVEPGPGGGACFRALLPAPIEDGAEQAAVPRNGGAVPETVEAS
jgi:signal transduction histidine kinase